MDVDDFKKYISPLATQGALSLPQIKKYDLLQFALFASSALFRVLCFRDLHIQALAFTLCVRRDFQTAFVDFKLPRVHAAKRADCFRDHFPLSLPLEIAPCGLANTAAGFNFKTLGANAG